MGQQQLILLVLATVIVGVAIVVGIRAFTENSAKSNADALVQDLVRMANDAQAWKQKPAPFGGQAAGANKTDADNFVGLTNFGQLGYGGTSATSYTNLNGTFTLTPGIATGLTISAVSLDPAATDQNAVSMTVCGIKDGNIDAAITKLKGSDTGDTVACVAG